MPPRLSLRFALLCSLLAAAGCGKKVRVEPMITPPDMVSAGPDLAESDTPTCIDSQLNGKETDVDCGGGACPKCKTGEICKVASDCVSDKCMAGKCQFPGCADGAFRR